VSFSVKSHNIRKEKRTLLRDRVLLADKDKKGLLRRESDVLSDFNHEFGNSDVVRCKKSR
jgi:hypothetical protein